VRLVGADGAQIGIKPLPEALTMARELELDLVEVADKANPPVCRIMDYGKYKYEAAQRAKESRKKSTNVVVKEMKYRPKIGAGDFDTKTKKVEHFLSEGHKVKVTIMFRGREMQHPELGRKILDHVAEAVVDQGRVEVYPRLDGRNMTMVLGPDKKAQAAAEKRRQAENEESAPTSVAESEESAPTSVAESEESAPTSVAESEEPTPTSVAESEEPTPTSVAAEASPDSDTTGV
jgi:translation initiation factor IF-3